MSAESNIQRDTGRHPEYDTSDPRHYGGSRFDLRLWHGMTTWAWFSLLLPNIHRVSPRRYGLVLSVTALSLLNSVFALLDRAIHGRAVRRTEFHDDPVVILGFARSGTTLLNELLACDPRLAYPDNIHCFQPETFLVTQKALRDAAARKPPQKRPMDDIDVAPDAPQEDEIALLVAGVPSPYRVMAFPSLLDRFRAALEAENADPRLSERWTRDWLWFLRRVQYDRPGKRLLLKSPTHTVRAHRILRAFPGAKFIHIIRDPYRIFQSNLKVGAAMTATQGLQVRRFDEAAAADELLEGFVRFHEGFARIRDAIPENQIVTIAYEDLVKDPAGVLREVYARLDLGDFAPVEAPLAAYLERRKDYRTNTYGFPPETLRKINARWDDYFRAYGYDKRPVPGEEGGTEKGEGSDE